MDFVHEQYRPKNSFVIYFVMIIKYKFIILMLLETRYLKILNYLIIKR